MNDKKSSPEGARERSERKKDIGDRLKQLRKRGGFEGQDEAYDALKKAGFKRGKESYKSYEKGAREIPPDEASLAIKVFGSPDGSFEWLFSGDREPEWGSQPQNIIRPSFVMLPRLTAREAEDMPAVYEKVKEKAKRENRLTPVTSKADHEVGPLSFLFSIEDDSMIPAFPFDERRFLPGDDVLIDPDVIPRPGDFVCAKVDAESGAVFRKYQEAENRKDPKKNFVLKPLNPNFRTQVVGSDNPGRIIGCMIRHISYRR